MTVYLVGAGPGDPGLITARGLELVRACDALVFDRLVSPELVAESPADAIRIGRDRLDQAEIEDLLVRLGRQGLDVVRLKGGDPFVFGRGGEEALALAAAGLTFEVVPGVSSLSAVPAAAGIPITHRGIASQVTIVSGHDPSELDFAALASAPGTLVFFMGLAALPGIIEGLLAAGKPPDTPSAVISRGTTPEQETVVAPIGELASAAFALASPALIVVGDVAALSAKLVGGRHQKVGAPCDAREGHAHDASREESCEGAGGLAHRLRLSDRAAHGSSRHRDDPRRRLGCDDRPRLRNDAARDDGRR
jgi:uroporphyrin-III C-methyltransferase